MVQRGPHSRPQASGREAHHGPLCWTDVSVKETSVCIVDDTGKIIQEVKVASEPKTLLAVLKDPTYRLKQIGLEAGPLSQWLFSALADPRTLTATCRRTSSAARAGS